MTVLNIFTTLMSLVIKSRGQEICFEFGKYVLNNIYWFWRGKKHPLLSKQFNFNTFSFVSHKPYNFEKNKQ